MTPLDSMHNDAIAELLKTSWLGRAVVYKDSVSSTQKIAHAKAKEGAAHGTIVIANEQTGGKGRKGRAWHSSSNQGVWMSIILRPDFLPQHASQLTLFTATVLADVLSQHIENVAIKWPNDILIEQKKLAGILTEIKTEQNRTQYVVIGTGININQHTSDLPSELRQKTTSLKMETNQYHDIFSFIQQVLTAFETKYSAFLRYGFRSVKDEWEAYAYRLGETIKVKTSGEHYEAVFSGIGTDGSLLVKRNGEIIHLYSATIDW